MEENNTLRKNRVYERKGVIPKEASTSKTKGPMPGAAQVENFLKKLISLDNYISIYEDQKE